ncbi:uncharacterized protein CIMG_03458 [Coccidioides immitis RS]|uniref:Uncharacterized protein n=2 Tax=Coccidioides immitis TaxID=5501 RepID=J3KBE5_COCIM|nr:uncharacterized protein CIMG_03458 [Coccidioides immitis RS]EAS32434.3 hypothetical protein CIMG_03458 [Coccidioides immitis RS]KMP07672.1 hypothetical protein CIRG_07353 [Coccidioides immitis RMSCC 2394]
MPDQRGGRGRGIGLTRNNSMDVVGSPKPERERAHVGEFQSTINGARASQAEDGTGRAAHNPQTRSEETPDGESSNRRQIAHQLRVVQETFGLHDNNLGDIATTGLPRGPLRVMNPDPTPDPSESDGSDNGNSRAANGPSATESRQPISGSDDSPSTRAIADRRRYIQGALYAMEDPITPNIQVTHPAEYRQLQNATAYRSPVPHRSRYRRKPADSQYRQPQASPPYPTLVHPPYAPRHYSSGGSQQAPVSYSEYPRGHEVGPSRQGPPYSRYYANLPGFTGYRYSQYEDLYPDLSSTFRRIWRWLDSVEDGSPKYVALIAF